MAGQDEVVIRPQYEAAKRRGLLLVGRAAAAAEAGAAAIRAGR
jgi:hypothetical protein